MSFYLPVIIVVLSNTFYHICAKSTPEKVNPFAALSVIYAVGAAASLVFYFIFNHGGSLIQEYKNLNWSSYLMGFTIIGLEAGFLYMYKAGWNISTGQIVSSSLLAVVLLLVGYFIFHEQISLQKIIGVVICMIGLYFINK